MKCVMLVANHFADSAWVDPRVNKEARALLAAGHEVVVLGTGKYGQNPARSEIKDGLPIIRKPTILHRIFARFRRRSTSSAPTSRNRQVHYNTDAPAWRTRIVSHALQILADVNQLLFCLAVLPEAIRQKADVYEGHDFNGLMPAYLAARLTGAKLVYNSHELWTECARPVPYSRLHRAIVAWTEKTMARRCDVVIAVTESVGQILGERYGITAPLVVPNVHPYVQVARSAEIRSQLTGGAEKKVAIFVGKISPTRGVAEIVDAARYLDDSVLVAIAGDGPLRSALEQRVKEEHLDSRVRFLGWIPFDNILLYIASADVGISPSAARSRSSLNNYYSLDNKSFQYILCGIPVIGNDQPEKRRLVERYGVGAIYDESDPTDLARTIERVLSNSGEYEAMCGRCREAARTELNWEVVSRRYVAALEDIVTAKGGFKRA